MGALVRTATTTNQRHFWWRHVMVLQQDSPGADEHQFLCGTSKASLTFDLRSNQGHAFEGLRDATSGQDVGTWFDGRSLLWSSQRDTTSPSSVRAANHLWLPSSEEDHPVLEERLLNQDVAHSVPADSGNDGRGGGRHRG